MNDSLIDKVEWLGMITGPDSINADVCAKAKVGGTDLGFPLYVEPEKKTFFFFGDTFLHKFDDLWRSNACAYASVQNVRDLVRFDGFLPRKPDGEAAEIVVSAHTICDDRTKIPTGAIFLDGNIYVFFFYKYAWPRNGVARERSMNLGCAVKSGDGGKTWRRVFDLTWFDHGEDPANEFEGGRVERLEKLAAENTDLSASGVHIDVRSHVGYYFTQIFPVDGKDGYIYLIGEGGYRSSGMKLGRVRHSGADFENFEAYSYFNGTDEKGEPIWLDGSAGLKTVCENDGAFIVRGCCGEQCCVYNEYLKKWMLLYTVPHDRIAYTLADHIWGPYGEPQTLIDSSYPFPNHDTSVYGGLTNEYWMEQNGKVFYFVMSQFSVYNSSIARVTLK